MKRTIGWLSLSVMLTAVAVAGCGDDDDNNNQNDNQNVNQAAVLCAGDPPLATLQDGVCRGTARVCDPAVGWVEPDYTAVTGFEADEVTCDELDNDCDGEVDEGLGSLYYVDLDGDGHGTELLTRTACSQPAGYVTTNDDCNDGNPLVSPDASEICDRLDNDCDGTVDLPSCNFCVGDTPLANLQQGACLGATKVCDPAEGWVEPNYGAIPAYEATEASCDGVDNNCDGDVDEGLTQTFYADFDGDGAGTPLYTMAACSLPAGFVANADDCNDGNPLVGPTQLEVCDGVDNDCDGTVDAGPCAANAHCAGEGANIACVCDEGYELRSGVCEWVAWDGLTSGHPIAASTYHSCGLQEGRLYCWGAGFTGQLGFLAPIGSVPTPTRVGAEDDWTYVDADSEFTCGIRSGELYCWGGNESGRLGVGDYNTRYAPEMVGDATQWSQVSTGWNHTCGIESGDLYCWGSNSYGKLGLGQSGPPMYDPALVPAPEGEFIDVSAGTRDITCGITLDATAKLYCWGGYNGNGGSGLGLGNCGDSTSYNVPTEVGIHCLNPPDWPAEWTAVDVGRATVCGINGGALYCWGRNAWGQVGNSDWDVDVERPVQIGTDTDWVAISVGRSHVCGIREDMMGDGTMYCWGKNDFGKLGLGLDLTGVADCGWHDGGEGAFYCDTPKLVDDTLDWDAVDAGRYHTCGIAEGVVYCWGNNSSSQLGHPDNAPAYSDTPIAISNP